MINQSRDSVSLGNCAERGQSMTNLHQRKMASQNEKSHLKASCDVFYFIFSDGHHRWPSPSTLFWTQPCPESSFSHDVNGKAVETFLGRTRSTRSTIRVWRIQKFTCWPRIHLRTIITDCLIATMFLLVIAVIIFYCILLSASSYLVQLCLYEYNSQNHRITSKSPPHKFPDESSKGHQGIGSRCQTSPRNPRGLFWLHPTEWRCNR